MTRAWAVLDASSTRLPRRQRWAVTREAVAEALAASGARAGAPRALPFGSWPRAADGAPAPVRGWYAGWTDTTGLVAAVVAPAPVALDAEWLRRPRWEAARRWFEEHDELARLGGDDRERVLALWCAKEAVLKLARTGLADLGRCRLLERVEDGAGALFRLELNGHRHEVPVRLAGEHLVAWAATEPLEIELCELQEVA